MSDRVDEIERGRATDRGGAPAGRLRRRPPRPRRPRYTPRSARATPRAAGQPRENVFELRDVGDQLRRQAGRRRRLDGHPSQRHHRADRALRLRQEHAAALAEPDERPDPDGASRAAASSTTARTSTGPAVDPVEVRKRIGMVFQKPNPFPKSIKENVAFGPKILGMKDVDGPDRAGAARRRALGRGEGPPRRERLRHVRRPAAAALHRPLPRGRPRRDPDGRALLGPRPDLDRQDRGPDDGAEGAATRS